MKNNYESYINYLEEVKSIQTGTFDSLMKTFVLDYFVFSSKSFMKIMESCFDEYMYQTYLTDFVQKIYESFVDTFSILESRDSVEIILLEAPLYSLITSSLKICKEQRQNINMEQLDYNVKSKFNIEFDCTVKCLNSIKDTFETMKKLSIEESEFYIKQNKKIIDYCENSVSLIKNLKEYDNSIISQLKLYGLALQWLDSYSLLVNNDGDEYFEFLEKFLNDLNIKEDKHINLKKECILNPILSIRKQMTSSNSPIYLFLANTVIKIVSCELLPNDLQTADAALTISKYFENKRADNLKEAINLYFQEKNEKMLSDKEKEENEKTRKMLQEQIANIKSLIETNIETEAKNNAGLSESISAVFKSVTNKQDAITDKYNELVDKYNDLAKEHNEIVETLKNN